jgi:hypothetical protein
VSEALYHIAVAVPLPLIGALLAVRVRSWIVRTALMAGSIAFFLLVYVLSYMVFCRGCT